VFEGCCSKSAVPDWQAASCVNGSGLCLGDKPGKLKLSKKPNNVGEKKNPGSLSGWPGYRTRSGRSGYDPVDSRTESAHMFGVFIQRFFTGQVKTKNAAHLFLLAVSGGILVLPFTIAITETYRGNPMPLNSWIILIIAGVVGLVALFNFVKNMIRINR
jgi:hypothetical protein